MKKMSSEKIYKNNLRIIEQEEIPTVKLNCINGYFPEGIETICICNEGYTNSEEATFTNGMLDKCNEKINATDNFENINYDYSENVSISNVIYESGKMSIKSIIFYICLIILIVILITWLSFKIAKKIKKYCFCCCENKENKDKKIKKKVEEESVRTNEHLKKNQIQKKKKEENMNQSFTTENNPLKMLNSKGKFYICEENGNVLMEINNKLVPNVIAPNINQDIKKHLNNDNHNIKKKEYKDNQNN